MKTLSAALLFVSLSAFGAEIHVAPSGSDTNPGTKDRPFATLARAQQAARAEKGSTVWLHGGTYYLDKTLTLTPEDSGTAYRAEPGETPVLSGGREITGWKKLTDEPAGVSAKAKGRLWVADIPKGWCFHFLNVDGKPMPRAKLNNGHWRTWPSNFNFGNPGLHGQKLTFANKAILANIPSNGDVELSCMMTQYGVMGNGVLRDIDPAAGTAAWHSTQTFLGFRTRGRNFTLENALPFIDIPGEWCVDSAAGKVYLWPADGTPDRAKVVAPVLYELVKFQGDEAAGKPVENVTLSGLTLVSTDRMPEDRWPADWLRRQWENVDGMIQAEGVKNCVITGNRLLFSGGAGITLRHFCQGVEISGNEIGWPGSSGVFLEGYGPGTLDVNKGNVVTRNWIHDIGQDNYWHSSSIQIFQSGSNRITLNLLQRSAYTCVSLTGIAPVFFNDPAYFFRDDPANSGEFKPWTMFRVRSEDFPKNEQDGVRRIGKFRFDRTNMKRYIHTRDNLIENNIVVEPEQKLDEGGAIYAWCTGKGNVWKDNLIFKSSGMPGSSILALDDIAEYFTITGNVIWVNGRAGCGTVGVRPNERGNTISGNIRACFLPEHRDGGGGNINGIARKFYTTETGREAVDALEKTIVDKVNRAGGWPGDPKTGIPREGETIKAVQRVLPKGEHMTIE